jgi:hypothetical protein
VPAGLPVRQVHGWLTDTTGSLSSQRVEVLATTFRGRRQMLATSLYDDPAAGLCGEAPAGLDEHPEHGL